MEEAVQKIRVWASHGTPRQFYNEIAGRVNRLGGHDYKVKMQNDLLQVYEERREGGFLGLGGKKVRDVVLSVDFSGEEPKIEDDDVDPEFAEALAPLLSAH